METEIVVTCETCGQDKHISLLAGKVPTKCSRCRFPRLWEVLDRPLDPATRAFERSFAKAGIGRR